MYACCISLHSFFIRLLEKTCSPFFVIFYSNERLWEVHSFCNVLLILLSIYHPREVHSLHSIYSWLCYQSTVQDSCHKVLIWCSKEFKSTQGTRVKPRKSVQICKNTKNWSYVSSFKRSIVCLELKCFDKLPHLVTMFGLSNTMWKFKDQRHCWYCKNVIVFIASSWLILLSIYSYGDLPWGWNHFIFLGPKELKSKQTKQWNQTTKSSCKNTKLQRMSWEYKASRNVIRIQSDKGLRGVLLIFYSYGDLSQDSNHIDWMLKWIEIQPNRQWNETNKHAHKNTKQQRMS
jgi:hypothetical protein